MTSPLSPECTTTVRNSLHHRDHRAPCTLVRPTCGDVLTCRALSYPYSLLQVFLLVIFVIPIEAELNKTTACCMSVFHDEQRRRYWYQHDKFDNTREQALRRRTMLHRSQLEHIDPRMQVGSPLVVRCRARPSCEYLFTTISALNKERHEIASCPLDRRAIADRSPQRRHGPSIEPSGRRRYQRRQRLSGRRSSTPLAPSRQPRRGAKSSYCVVPERYL